MEQITKQTTEQKIDQTADAQAPLETKPPMTRGQRWLLLGVLGVGVALEFVIHYVDSARALSMVGIFWLAALAVFAACNLRRIACNATALAVGIPAALLALGQATRFVDTEIEGWLILAVPAAMMTFAVFATQEIPAGREGAAARGVLRGVFVKPFTAIPAFFRAIASLFRGGKGSTARRAGIGLLIGLPILVVVLLLLSSADAGMERLLGALFARVDMPFWLARAFRVSIAAMLFYSLFFNLTWGKRDALPKPVEPSWPLAAPAVVIGMLLAAYALFTYVQFTYLFGGTLPVDLTYSEYAREGFGQLICVTLINLTVLGVCLVKARPTWGMRAFETLLLLASALVLASAAWRLLLYIGAYGFTILRVLSLWLMVYLAFLTIAAGVRVYCAKMKLLRIASFALLYWYVALNLVPWSGVIDAWNLAFGH